MLLSALAVGTGAFIGACVRWALGLGLNAFFPAIPLGTLVANLSGGFLAGVAAALFMQLPAIAPEWRLFVLTGFLGGLTTFSTFSVEVFALIAREQWWMAMGAASLHLLGSLLLTGLGFYTVYLLRG